MKQMVLFICLTLMTTTAFARKGKGGDHKQEKSDKMRTELGLSEEQVAKMKEIREKRKASREQHREKVKAAREEFHTAMKNPKASKAELEKKFDQLEKLQSQGKREQFEMMLELRSLMDEKQIAKFNEKRGEWRNKWKEKRKGQHGSEDDE